MGWLVLELEWGRVVVTFPREGVVNSWPPEKAAVCPLRSLCGDLDHAGSRLKAGAENHGVVQGILAPAKGLDLKVRLLPTNIRPGVLCLSFPNDYSEDNLEDQLTVVRGGSRRGVCVCVSVMGFGSRKQFYDTGQVMSVL